MSSRNYLVFSGLVPHFTKKSLLILISDNENEEIIMSDINLREVVRLVTTTNFSNRTIARLTNIAHNSVSKYRKIIADKKLSLEWVAANNDKQLQLLFQSKKQNDSTKRTPDWNLVHKHMQARHQTLIQLWEEYCLSNPADAYCYSQFTHYYREHVEKIDVTMRKTYYGGETLFVDYAGRTIPWYDEVQNITCYAQIFVAVMGCSNHTFVHASKTQNLEDWIDAHIKMFEFFGGSTQVIVPDNLRSAVSKAGSFPIINRSYLECIRHYGGVVDPARVRHPKDKAKVEAGVLFISRWILTILSRRKFFSIDEINIAIRELLEKFNNRKFKRLPGTRRSRFEELDKPLLKRLPDEPFQFAEWVSEQKVPSDYHIYVFQHAYSVPYELVSEKVEARVTLRTVEIFHLSKRVAIHDRSDEKGGFTTNPAHRPANHQFYVSHNLEYFQKWAERIGPASVQIVQAQFKNKPNHSNLAQKACMELEKRCKAYGEDKFESACQRAIDIGSLTVKSVRSILQHRLYTGTNDSPPPIQSELPLHYHIRGSDYYVNGGL
jgi:transposase